MRPYMLGAGQGVGGDPSVKASAQSTGGVLTLIESETTGGAPPHVHSREDECFYVVTGTITVRAGDEAFEAGPRSFVFLPRGVPHAWDVVGPSATVLILTIPGGFEEFLREFHAATDAAGRDEVAATYGLRWLRSTTDEGGAPAGR